MQTRRSFQRISDILSFRLFFALLAAFLIAVIAVGYLISEEVTGTYIEVMQIIGVLASISLSAILAYLYLQMSDIQNQQKSIMQNQGKIMEAEHLPHIFIDKMEFSSESLSASLGERISNRQLGYETGELGRFREDLVEMSIHNAGNGLAKDLRVNIVLEARAEDGTIRFQQETVKKPVSRYHFRKGSSDNKQSQRRSGNNHQDFIKSGDSGEFWVLPKFVVSDGEETVKVPFSLVLDICTERDVQEVYVEVELLYRDMTDAIHREHINRGSVSLSDVDYSMRLGDIFKGNAVDRDVKEDYSMRDVLYPEDYRLDRKTSESMQ